jgi:hypothetical protein
MGCCNKKTDEKLLCYCFNISENAYIEALKADKGSVLKDFVVLQTKNNYCNCENLNPSKQCCLKEFKKMEISQKMKTDA